LALCYCGTPRLKEAVAKLEIALKEGRTNIAGLYETVLREIVAVEKETKQLLSN